MTQTPRLFNENGRGCYFAYWRDGRPELRSRAAQWREGRELVTAFPCDDGLLLVLLMPPVDRAADFRGRLEDEYRRTAYSVPGLAARLDGAETGEQGSPHELDRVVLSTLSGPGLGAAR